MRILYTRMMHVTACSILLSACVSQPFRLNKYIPGLGEMMGQISMRHAKLWYAGGATSILTYLKINHLVNRSPSGNDML